MKRLCIAVGLVLTLAALAWAADMVTESKFALRNVASIFKGSDALKKEYHIVTVSSANTNGSVYVQADFGSGSYQNVTASPKINFNNPVPLSFSGYADGIKIVPYAMAANSNYTVYHRGWSAK